MTPERRALPMTPALLIIASLVLCAGPASALRLVSYNILNYPGSTGPARDPYYRTILAPLGADVIVTGETQSQAGVTEFLTSVLNANEPGQWAAAPFVDGNDTDCGLFYKPSRVDFLGQWAFYPDAPRNLRLIHVYRVRPVGYSSAAAELRLYGVHLKASTGSANVTDRYIEAYGLRDSMEHMPPGTHAIVLGDFNFYDGTEPAMTRFLSDTLGNVGKLYDPLNLQAVHWQDNAGMVTHHTQSTCLNSPNCASGAATGGLDDRFDLILPTLNFNDGQGQELLTATYVSVGNDGQHLNKNITDAPTIPEGAGYADALIRTSDHLPQRVDLQVPARVSVAASLDLGTMIGGAATADLTILNAASVPADALDYSFAAPAGFAAPGGAFALAAGAPAASHTIATTPGPAGPRAGDLVITTDDPDHPTRLVSLSAHLLDHAAASLDSAGTVLSGTVDFGVHDAGGFTNQSVRVHNLGYHAAQARLALDAASITGGNDRFAIVGGFSPSLIADVGRNVEIGFDAAGATADSSYEATLTFTSADEPLPGAAAQPGLSVTLRASLGSGALDTSFSTAPPATRLYPPFPNPLARECAVRFDLAGAGDVRVEVFDLNGRRIAMLAGRRFEPGRYTLHWSGRDNRGRLVDPGLYFVGLSATGFKTETARLVVLH